MSKSEWAVLAAIVLIVSFITYKVYPKITAEDAADAIVGEAANQDFDTQVCVAQGIRHRGTLRGVHGFHAHHNQFEDSSTYQIALDAWEQSTMVKDQINGARNWGTEGEIPWGKKYKAVCGDLYFY